MRSLDEAEALYHGLRDRDRTIASLQGKQRMVALFDQLLDDDARQVVDARLRHALDEVRGQARALAAELARAALLELELDALPRIGQLERRFAAHLETRPSEALDLCGDLLTFIKEMRELRHPARARPPEEY
jgi:predicted component of type VI protein secretion system